MQSLFHLTSHRLGHSARRATTLSLTASGFDLFLQFLTLMILARLLTPVDFGVLAMVTPFIWFIMNFGDLGLAGAVLQQTRLTEGQASAVFGINLLAGFLFAALFLAASPLLGWFYHDARVVPVAAALSLVFVLSGLTAIQRALLRRALQFGALFRAQVAASTVSSVIAVALALAGAGYWALAARTLADPLTYTIVVTLSSGWLPSRPEWDSTTKALIRFGGYNIGYSLLNSIARQGDNILIGWRYGSGELGPYALAYRLFFFPVQQFAWPIGMVMFPVLSRLKDEPERLKKWYTELLRLMTLVTYPPLFSLLLCADDLVYVLVGPQWNETGQILRMIGPVSALQVGYATIDWLMQSQGRFDRAFGWAVISSSTYMISFILGLPWGAFGVAAGLAGANLVLFIPGFVYGTRGTPIALADVLKAMLPSFGLTVLSVAAVYMLRAFIAQDWHPFVRLLGTGAAIATVMIVGASILYRHHYSPRDLLWLGYVLGVAPWAHRVAWPLHEWNRWQVRRRRQRDLERRMELLRSRIAQRSVTRDEYRLALAELSPELDKVCQPLRRANQAIALADIDQEGFLRPRLGLLWAVSVVDENAFVPRSRFELTVVDCGGYVGVRKNFRGDKAAFVNELEASLDLGAAGCHVPAILAVNFERLAITFAYINGVVVREALAQAGARIRGRDVTPVRSSIANPIRNYRLHKKRIMAGRRLIDQVLRPETIARVAEGLLAIHRAGYTLEDVKYGNMIIEARSQTPYFVDCERALPLHAFPCASATYQRDRDAEKLNQLFGTDLLTAKVLRKFRLPADTAIYSPFYAGARIWWGTIWNPDLGILRWRHILADHVPVPRGGRILDLGANNGFNALQMLRAGANEVIGVEIDTGAIEQGLFVKRVFEWADNTEYRFSCIHGSHADIGSMNLGRFDLVTAFCTLYYLSSAAMSKTVSDLAQLTDVLVLQCNNERSIERSDPETYTKASLSFNVELVRNNGFPNVTVIERRGSNRPLVIARTR
jgi:polysaccharide transporter, PST family